MKRKNWEYRVISTHTQIIRDVDLNIMGANGWELVSAYLDQDKWSYNTCYVFKRPVQDTSPSSEESV